MKKILILLIILLPIVLFAQTISLNIPLSAPRDGFDKGDFGKLGWGTISSPGCLQLPVKQINILLPPGAEIVRWDVNLSGTNPMNGKAPERNSAFSDGEEQLLASPNRDITSTYSFLGTHKWGDLNYAAFSVVPATWNGETWLFSSSCQISVDYRQAKNAARTIPPVFKDESFFANPQDISRWYAKSNNRNYDVLIISTPALYAQLADWITLRESQGLVVSFTDVSTALNAGTGTTAWAKLRNYLQTQYNTSPFSYLLIVGDYDTVPVANLVPEPDGSDTVPSDFFYGDLSSDWDTDNDGRLGEYSTGFMNQDYGVDFTPEVYVGRISTNSATQVATIANRIVAFEQNSALWKDKNLFPAAFSNYLGEPEPLMPATDSATYSEFLRNTILAGMPNTSMYEQAGVVPSYPSEYPLTYEDLRNLLNTQSWGYVNWSAHGSSSSSSRKIWLEDTNNNNFPESEEMVWMNLVNRQTFDNLGNTDGTVIFAASCYNGMIDSDNASLAEYALQKKAVGVIAATRTGWYKVGWLNPGWGGLSSLNYHFVENYRQSKISLGAAHALANLLHSQYYLFGDPIDADGIIYPELQNIYTYLLFGDPLIGYTPDAVPPTGEILVWEPSGSAGLPVVSALRNATNMNVIYSDKLIVDYNYLDHFAAVFCLFGFGSNSYQLNPLSFEYGLLNSYLTGGGKLYLEGDVTWNPTDDFWGKFGTHAPLDIIAHIDAVRHNQSPAFWQYNDPQFSTQVLIPYVTSAQVIFTTQNIDPPDSYIGIWNSNGSYRTIASSFSLAKVLSGSYDLTDLVSIICDTLGVETSSPVGNSDAGLTPLVQKIGAYPNPSRGSSTISFSIPNKSTVSLDVYNLKGQKVKSLKHASLGAGNYQVPWDGKDAQGKVCGNGVYFYRLHTEAGVKSIKQVLLR